MTNFDHHFIPLDPIPAGLAERAALRDLAQTLFHTKDGHDLRVRFIGDATGVRVMGVTVPAAARAYVRLNDCMKMILESALTAIRLTYDQASVPVFTESGFLTVVVPSDDETCPFPRLAFADQTAKFLPDTQDLVGSFSALSRPRLRTIAALMAEAQVPTLPIHYGILSLIRAIELLWPIERVRNEVLDKYEGEFKNLQMSHRPFRSALSEIRIRCASGAGRGAPETFVGIADNEPMLMPLAFLLSRVAAEGVREIFELDLGVLD